MSDPSPDNFRGTEAAIYDAALGLMAALGYHGTSLRAVAKVVGVQMSSLYYYFPSKQELLVGIMRRTMDRLYRAVDEAVQEAEGPVAQLAAGIRAHVLFHADNRRDTMITDSELRSLEPDNLADIIQLRDDYNSIFIGLLKQGRAAQLLSYGDVHVTANALMTLLSGVAIWYKPDGRLGLPQIADQLCNLFFDGVLVRASDERPPRRPRKVTASSRS